MRNLSKTMPVNTIDYIHSLIREDAFVEARAELRILFRRKPRDRRQLVRLAQLARLAYMPEKSIELLHRRVRPQAARAGINVATEEERAEYGMALAHIGAGGEALGLLSQISLQRHPWIFGPLCLAHFRNFDWARTLPMIRKYLLLPQLSPKDRLTARELLGTALLHGSQDYLQSQRVLEATVREAELLRFPVIRNQARLLLIQCCYYQKKWASARRQLARLERTLPEESDTIFSLNLRQWQALVAFHSSGNPAAALKQLASARRGFQRLGRWWSARSCFFYEAVCKKDERMLEHLYFGTPLPQIRKHLMLEFGKGAAALPMHYDLRISPMSSKGPWQRLDLITGKSRARAVRLKLGQLPRKVLRALSLDFFAPPNVAQLFERIYPGEYFHPTAALVRTRQALLQTRRWLAEHRIPLLIVESQGLYRLQSEYSFTLRVPAPEAVSSETVALAKEAFGERQFSSHELAEHLRISERSARRSLKEAVERLQIIPGSGRALYRVRP